MMTNNNWKSMFGLETINILVCDICLDQYNEKSRKPKFLACHHSFCEMCLMQVVNKETWSIECPSCRKLTSLPDGGVKELQTNFYMTHMKDILIKLGANSKVQGCVEHSNQPTSFFCRTCSRAICRDCMVLDHKEDNGHKIQDVKEAEFEQRESLANEMEASRATIQTVQAHLNTLQSELGNLTTTKTTVTADIEAAFNKYAQILDQRRSHLLQKVNKLYDEKKQAIIERTDGFSHTVVNLNNMLSHADTIAHKGTLSDVIAAKKTIQSTTNGLKTSVADMNIGTNYLAFDCKAGLRDFQANAGKLANVYADGFLPSRIHFEPKELIAALPSEFNMQVFSYSGEKITGYPIEVQVFDPSGIQLPSETKKDGNQEYIITFRPQMSGEHKCVALFLSQPIKGSETHICVRSNNPVQIIGGLGPGEGKFRSPRAVVRDKHGRLYVADTGNKLIQKLEEDGNFLYQFKISGTTEECSTCDLALNVEKDLIVCTETMVGTSVNPTMGNTVAIYTSDGSLKNKFTNKLMKCALCVATNSHSEIIISDYLVHSLFMYDEEGKFIRRIGNANCFSHPAFICTSQDDTIIVSDTNNDVIQMFDREGNFIKQFGQTGSGKGQLKQPFGVSHDGENILVVDSGNSRIQVFHKDGSFVSMIESADDPLNQPRGLTVTEDGHVLVADRDSNCIKKYRYK